MWISEVVMKILSVFLLLMALTACATELPTMLWTGSESLVSSVQNWTFSGSYASTNASIQIISNFALSNLLQTEIVSVTSNRYSNDIIDMSVDSSQTNVRILQTVTDFAGLGYLSGYVPPQPTVVWSVSSTLQHSAQAWSLAESFAFTNFAEVTISNFNVSNLTLMEVDSLVSNGFTNGILAQSLSLLATNNTLLQTVTDFVSAITLPGAVLSNWNVSGWINLLNTSSSAFYTLINGNDFLVTNVTNTYLVTTVSNLQTNGASALWTTNFADFISNYQILTAAQLSNWQLLSIQTNTSNLLIFSTNTLITDYTYQITNISYICIIISISNLLTNNIMVNQKSNSEIFTNTVITTNYLPEWHTEGSAGFSTGQISYASLAFNNGIPYMAYEDVANDSKATVMYYRNSTWVVLGAPGFSVGIAQHESLAFNNGIPYVAYEDDGNGSKATVMYYSNSTWNVLGTGGFSDGTAYGISLSFNNGISYVAYPDGVSNNMTTVEYYSNSTWNILGTQGFSAGAAFGESLAFNNGMPYVAYQDNFNGSKATVMYYSNSTWNVLGAPGFSTGMAFSESLAFNNGIPYVAYEDDGNGIKATVMYYSNSTWNVLGVAGFSTGAAQYESLAFNNGIPYAAYEDIGNGSNATLMTFK